MIDTQEKVYWSDFWREKWEMVGICHGLNIDCASGCLAASTTKPFFLNKGFSVFDFVDVNGNIKFHKMLKYFDEEVPDTDGFWWYCVYSAKYFVALRSEQHAIFLSLTL